MANNIFQPIFVVLFGWLLCVDGEILTNPRVSFPFANRFRIMDSGDVLNVTLSDDYDGPVKSYDTEELKKWKGSDCYRECDDKDKGRICYFDWTLEFWNVYGVACRGCQTGVYADCYRPECVFADGVERGILTVNRELPGPGIHVCKNDIIVVDIKNRMSGSDESFHWHGVLQHGTPWMDGVSYVTQCPIHSENTFRYVFSVTKKDTGTQYYHSHTGHHKVDGLFGSLVVRDSRKKDPNSYTYECDIKEHTMVVNDWYHILAEDLVPGLQNTSQVAPSVLINGRGQYRNPLTNQLTKVPLSVFRMNCNKCKSYRFRVISSLAGVCPFQLQIEGHRPRVIATDSYSIKPVYVDSIFAAAGERVDFVLPCMKPEVGTEFWISVTLRGVCQRFNIKSFAVLSVADESITDEQLAIPTRPFPDADFPQGITLNRPNTQCGGPDYCPTDLQDAERVLTKEEKRWLIDQKPCHTFVLTFNNYALPDVEKFHYEIYHHTSNLGRRIFVGAFNNITCTFPNFSPDSQPRDIVDNRYGSVDSQTFCDRNNLPSYCDGYAQCPCVHRLKFKKDCVYDIILIDDTPQNNSLSHPIHMHGHGYYPMNQYTARPDQPLNRDIVRAALNDGTFYQKFGQMRRPGVDYRNPCKKDTIQVPSKGVMVVRVLMDNPGFWLLHCHIDWHLGIGMAVILQVGELDEIKPAPETFPKCRNYMPRVVLD